MMRGNGKRKRGGPPCLAVFEFDDATNDALILTGWSLF